MARRNEGTAELLVTLVSQFPWWIGLILALVTYVLLHSYAQIDIAVAHVPTDAGAVIHSQLLKTMASIGQYFLPVLFLFGALLSFLQRKKRRQLWEESAASSESTVLNDTSWQEFELLVGEAFRRKGYSVHETGGGGADGGVDLVISKESKTILVQCKQWKTRQVGVKPVRELAGVVASKGAAGGIVVSSGSYTEEARRFAKEAKITLIDGEQLHKLIKGIKGEAGTVCHTPENKSVEGGDLPVQVSCPRCGSEMVKREAKRGQNTGKMFWGCTRYPVCRGTRDV